MTHPIGLQKNVSGGEKELGRISPSLEDYIEMIYNLLIENGSVRTTDIANALGVSKPSVNRAIKSLKEKGLANQEWYGEITLTKSGSCAAKEVLDRHNLIKTFLVDVLGVDKETAEQEACEIEHCMSEGTIEKLNCFINRRSNN
jgi:Mn-dependent DtxR family transcriptional regulator